MKRYEQPKLVMLMQQADVLCTSQQESRDNVWDISDYIARVRTK